MRLAQTILFFCWLWSFQTLFAQSFEADLAQFQQAVEQGNRSQAQQLLAQLHTRFPQQIHRTADASERLFLNSQAQKSGTDSLLATYQAGAQAQPDRTTHWLFRQTALAVRFPAWYGHEGLAWAHTCVLQAPLSCPIQTFQFWGDLLESTPQNRRPGSNALLAQWQDLERALLMRLLNAAGRPEEVMLLQRQLHHKLQAVAPRCSAFRTRNHNTTPEITFAIGLLALHHCDNEANWAWATQQANQLEQAWPLAQLAAHAQFQGDWTSTLKWLNQAIELEKEPLLQAELLHRKSIALAAQEQYRAARTALKQAIDLAPGHGEFLLELADLYLKGSAICAWTAFDAKAVYWLAIDCCRKARSSAPHLSAEADQRIYRYKQLMPTAEEIRFRGLQAGDTWPLPCWMGTVTTVKVN